MSELERRAQSHIKALLTDVPGARGALLASVDGRPLASELPDHDAGSTAAIVASSCGLGARLADLTGEGTVEEIVVRTAKGYVVIYVAGERGVLTVLCHPSINLARLHLRARDLAPVLGALVDAAGQ